MKNKSGLFLWEGVFFLNECKYFIKTRIYPYFNKYKKTPLSCKTKNFIFLQNCFGSSGHYSLKGFFLFFYLFCFKEQTGQGEAATKCFYSFIDLSPFRELSTLMVAFFVCFLCPYRLSQFYKCKGKKWVIGIVRICEPWNTKFLRWNCFSNFRFRKVQDMIVIGIYLQNMSYIKHYLYIDHYQHV